MRSSVLNSVGVYNRSKLTRLVVDHDWDKKVWEESWELRNRQDLIKQSMGEDCSGSIEGALTSKKPGTKRSREADALAAKSKKRRLDGEGGACWGEELITREVAREEFLYDQENKGSEKGKLIQKKLTPQTGISLISAIIIQELIKEAVCLSHQASKDDQRAGHSLKEAGGEGLKAESSNRKEERKEVDQTPTGSRLQHQNNIFLSKVNPNTSKNDSNGK